MRRNKVSYYEGYLAEARKHDIWVSEEFWDRLSPYHDIHLTLDVNGFLSSSQGQRGYKFDTTKISRAKESGRIAETRGQLLYEWKHLKSKLRKRAPQVYGRIARITRPQPHPLFRIVPGGVRDWEKP